MSSNYLFQRCIVKLFMSCCLVYHITLIVYGRAQHKNKKARKHKVHVFTINQNMCNVKKRSLLSFYFENERLVVASASSPDLSTSYYKPSHYLVSFEWISSAAHSLFMPYIAGLYFFYLCSSLSRISTFRSLELVKVLFSTTSKFC